MVTQEKLKELYYYEDGSLFNKKTGKEVGSSVATKYAKCTINKKTYYIHRLVWLYFHGSFPQKGVDHIDRNRMNNKIENLREADQSLNNTNSKLRKDNTTGVKNVYLDKRRGSWYVEFWDKSNKQHLGYFKDFNEAVKFAKEERIKRGYVS